MTSSARSRKVRWLVPVGVLAVVAAGATLNAGAAGASAPDLPAKTASQLLADVAKATPQPFSGSVTETADLGLPALPGTSSTSLSWQSLISGTHTAKVWVASPQQVRLALVGDLAESDVIRSGRDVWVWQSGDSSVGHLKRMPRADQPVSGHSSPPSITPSLTPDTVAAQVLAAIDPTTQVVVDRTATVAGRPVYELVLSPKQTGSLVSSVRVAIDSETSMPLGVWVYAVGQDNPAFETEFTAITFTKPDASVFDFTPPAGATVSTQVVGGPFHTLPLITRTGTTAPVAAGSVPAVGSQAGADKPKVIGSGWTTVVEASGLPSLVNGLQSGGAASASQSTAALDLLLRTATPVSGSYGHGRVIETALLTVLMLDDGRVFAGAVTPAVLEQAASAAK